MKKFLFPTTYPWLVIAHFAYGGIIAALIVFALHGQEAAATYKVGIIGGIAGVIVGFLLYTSLGRKGR